MTDYEKEYKTAFEKAKKLKETCDSTAIIGWCEYIFPSLKETEGEKIRKELIDYLKERKSCESYGQYVLRYNRWIAWLEKQGDKPLFTFDDILALQCCMETVKKVQEDKELYEQLQSLHDRLHDAYWLEKQGEQKSMKVYRVENEAEQKGLWRKFDGMYQPLFDMLTDGKCKDLPMEDSPIYREGGKRWFASAPSKETLQKWFSKKDLEELVSKGFTISEFEVIGYKKVSDFEYIFTRDNIINRNYLEVSDIYPEQKDFAPKVEAKFKIGDWVVYNRTDHSREVMQIYDIRDNRYYFNDNIHFSWSVKECDEKSHLWSIKEAREGDVLATESGWTCIFKALVNEETFGSYCFMDSTEWFYGLGSECHTLKEEFNGKIQPAKKEQRDLFFKKMQESGYVWNAEKKVLKNLKSKFNIGDWIVSANGKVNQVISVDADNVDFDGYTLDDGVYFSGTWCNSYHLWTIKDAKEGDILSYETDEGDLWIMLYWSLYEPYEGHVHYHALLVNDDFTDKGTCCICIDNLKPATIEQHELLFRKMKEEGYQWDKNKKELIKL